MGVTFWLVAILAVMPLLASCVGTIAHSFGLAKAAPIMLSLKQTPDDEKVLTGKLNMFAAWHAFRAIFQFLTFVALVWALVDASRLAWK